MIDNMAIEDPSPERVEGMARLFFGTGLLLAGIGVFIWVIINAVALLNGDPAFPVMQNFPGVTEGITIHVPQGRVNLSPEIMKLSAYGVIVVVLAIVARVASAFLQAGSHLLQPDVRTALRKIAKKIKESAD